MIQQPGHDSTNVDAADIDFVHATDTEFLDVLPMHGAADPAARPAGTTPGSFAMKADVGGPRMYSSPDTPGMPAPSSLTASRRVGLRPAPRAFQAGRANPSLSSTCPAASAAATQPVLPGTLPLRRAMS